MTHRQKRSDLNIQRNRQSSSFLSGLFHIILFLAFNACILFLLTTKPKLELSVNDSTDYITTDFTLKVKSVLPVKSLTFNYNNEPLEVEKTENNTYSATLHSNGSLEICAVGFNGMISSLYETVNCLDDAPPTVESYTYEANELTLYIEDSQAGIDFNSIYALDEEGMRIRPSSFDKEASLVKFDTVEQKMTIHISDLSGNEAAIAFSNHTVDDNGNEIPKKQTEKETTTTTVKDNVKDNVKETTKESSIKIN